MGMRDIAYKKSTLRTALAVGKVIASTSSIKKIENNEIPKGHIFDIARAAGLIGAKQCQFLIPHCHPVNIDGLSIDFEIEHGNEGMSEVNIEVTAKSIGRTGIEMEALTSVSVTALTIYDLLKPLNDKNIQITDIKLLDKQGGKTDNTRFTARRQIAKLLICSPHIAAGAKEDKLTGIVSESVSAHNCELEESIVTSGKQDDITSTLEKWCDEKVPFIFTAGGTGLGRADQTIEALEAFCDKPIPGIAEAMRGYGNDRTPVAMLSRSYAGVKDETIIVALPGSSAGAEESLLAIIPGLFHGHWMLKG